MGIKEIIITHAYPILLMYFKIPVISPGLVYLFKRLFGWVYFQGGLSFEGLIIACRESFAIQSGLDLTIKTALNTTMTA